MAYSPQVFRADGVYHKSFGAFDVALQQIDAPNVVLIEERIQPGAFYQVGFRVRFVTRLANRMGWVKGSDAVKIEQQLNTMCPKEDWIMLSHYLIAHGRKICKARSPLCSECFLQTSCPKLGV